MGWFAMTEKFPRIVRLWECDGAGDLSSVQRVSNHMSIKKWNTDFGAIFTVECAKVRTSEMKF